MEFFNNKENDILKFKINSEGINVNSVEPRLILMTKENKNVLLIGKIEDGVCKFEIPELTIYEKGDHGKIKFEIISEDLYFPVWNDDFEIKTKASVKIEEMISEIQQSSKNKPSISVTEAKFESKPIIEKRIEKEIVETNSTLSKLESIFEKNVPIIEEEDDSEEVSKIKENKKDDNSIIKFELFK